MSYFASMLKPYASDVLVAVALTWLAIEVERTRTIRRWMVLCVAAAIAVWFSYSAILVFGGISVALCVRFLGRNLPRSAMFILGNVIVAVPFLLLMHWVESAQHTNLMDEYWGNEFVDLAHPARVPFWCIQVLYKLGNFESLWGGVYVLPFAAVGLIALIRQGRAVVAAILVGPLVMNLLTAGLHRYPFGGRVTLYLIASVFILASAGAGAVLEWIVIRWKSGSRGLVLIPAVICALIALGGGISNAIRPHVFSDYRALARAIRERSRDEDIIYAPYTAEFRYYWPAVGHRARTFGVDYADEIPAHRFWLAWSRPHPREIRDLEAMRRWARTFATERDSYVESGNYAYAYEIASKPPHTRWNDKKIAASASPAQ
jgi:hypothetical protein